MLEVIFINCPGITVSIKLRIVRITFNIRYILYQFISIFVHVFILKKIHLFQICFGDFSFVSYELEHCIPGILVFV